MKKVKLLIERNDQKLEIGEYTPSIQGSEVVIELPFINFINENESIIVAGFSMYTFARFALLLEVTNHDKGVSTFYMMDSHDVKDGEHTLISLAVKKPKNYFNHYVKQQLNKLGESASGWRCIREDKPLFIYSMGLERYRTIKITKVPQHGYEVHYDEFALDEFTNKEIRDIVALNGFEYSNGKLSSKKQDVVYDGQEAEDMLAAFIAEVESSTIYECDSLDAVKSICEAYGLNDLDGASLSDNMWKAHSDVKIKDVKQCQIE